MTSRGCFGGKTGSLRCERSWLEKAVLDEYGEGGMGAKLELFCMFSSSVNLVLVSASEMLRRKVAQLG